MRKLGKKKWLGLILDEASTFAENKETLINLRSQG
jgi:hypothetical protein